MRRFLLVALAVYLLGILFGFILSVAADTSVGVTAEVQRWELYCEDKEIISATEYELIARCDGNLVTVIRHP